MMLFLIFYVFSHRFQLRLAYRESTIAFLPCKFKLRFFILPFPHEASINPKVKTLGYRI